MTRSLALLAALSSFTVFADIIPEEVAVCRGKGAGASCVGPDGLEGTCQELSISRPDYSSGIPPKTKTVTMLSCVATAKGSARSMAPWLGLGLAFLAVLAAMTLRGKSVRPAAA